MTHAAIFSPPTSAAVALEFLEELLKSPSLVLLAEGAGHFGRLRDLVRAGRVLGARVHDARIAAMCLEHGVTELWTADRDFGRFPAVAARNPLVE